jgi:hypothetical protein
MSTNDSITQKQFNHLKNYFKNNSINMKEDLIFNGNSCTAKDYFENATKKHKPDPEIDACQGINSSSSSSNVDALSKCHKTISIPTTYEKLSKTRDNGLDVLYSAAAEAFEFNENDTASDDLVESIGNVKITEGIEDSDELADSEMEKGYEVVPIITFSPRNPHYPQMINESRLEYLCRVPMLIQAAVNSSNLEMLKYVMDETVTENCLHQTSQTAHSYRGVINGTFKLLQF